MAHYCVQILKSSKPWLNLISDLRKSKPRLTKPTPQMCSTAYRDQNPGTRPPTVAARATTRGQRLLELSHALLQILDSQLRFQSHEPPRRPYRPPIYLAWEFRGHTTLHAPPCATWVSGFCSTRRWTTHTRHPRLENWCWCHLTSLDDVITARQQPCKHRHVSPRHVISHVSPSPCQRHVIRMSQRCCSPIRDRTRNLEPTRAMYPLTLTLDQLTLTFCVDPTPKVKISDRACLAHFFA